MSRPSRRRPKSRWPRTFDGDLSAYRADDGTVVVAASEREARTQVRELTGADSPTLQQLD
jgi:hypothetical protein